MKLTQEQVEHIAHLARLGVTESEKAIFAEQLSSILEYVGQLQEVNTTGVEPTSQATNLESVMRDDVVEPIDDVDRQALLDQAPHRLDDLIQAQSVFEKK